MAPSGCRRAQQGEKAGGKCVRRGLDSGRDAVLSDLRSFVDARVATVRARVN